MCVSEQRQDNISPIQDCADPLWQRLPTRECATASTCAQNDGEHTSTQTFPQLIFSLTCPTRNDALSQMSALLLSP